MKFGLNFFPSFRACDASTMASMTMTIERVMAFSRNRSVEGTDYRNA